MRNYLGLLDGQELVEGYDHYIWMSDRCLEGITWCEKNGLNYEIVPKNWKTNQEIRACMDYLDKVKKVILSYAAEILNEYHHSTYDVEQWNILLTQWLNCYLASYYDKYLKLKQVERMGVKCECDLYEPDEIVTSLDYLEYTMLLSQTDAYHVYQYTRLYQEMQPLGKLSVRVNTIYKRPSLPTKPELSSKHTKAWWFKQALRFCKKIVRKTDDVVLFNSYLPPKLVMKSMLKTFGSVMDYTGVTDYTENERYELPLNVDTKWREAEGPLIQGDDKFVALMCRMLKKELPVAYVEEFPFLQERVLGRYKYAMNAKAILFGSSASYHDEMFKIYLMGIKKTKAIFCGVQHGGGYGVKNIIHLNDEYNICDIFYTWGWNLQDCRTNFYGMPVVKLLGGTVKSKKLDDILYVGYSYPKNIWRIYPPELVYDCIVQDELDFLRQINNTLKIQLRVRPYMHDYGWGATFAIKKSLPRVLIDPILNIYESITAANLVLLADWSTVFQEVICLNKPVIVRCDDLCLEDRAKEEWNALKEVGILVQTFDEMEKQMEAVLPDIDGWWHNPHRQEVVRMVRRQHAYLPSNAENVWEKELLRLAAL